MRSLVVRAPAHRLVHHSCGPMEDRLMRRLALSLLAMVAVQACQDTRAPMGPERAGRVQGNVGQGPSAELIPGQYIVVLKPTAQNVGAIARELVALHGGALRFTYTHALQGFSAQLSDAAAAALAQHPLVAYVEQDQVMHAIT